MSKEINFGSLDILFNTPQGREVIDDLFLTYNKTKDIFKAVDVAIQKAENNNISGILQVYGALDLLKVIALLNPQLFLSIENLVISLIGPKPKPK